MLLFGALGRLLVKAIRAGIRWGILFAAASTGSWLGHVLVAALHKEPVEPLLRVNRDTFAAQDVTPGIAIAEIGGRFLRLNIFGEAVLAVAGAALAVVLTGAWAAPSDDDTTEARSPWDDHGPAPAMR